MGGRDTRGNRENWASCNSGRSPEDNQCSGKASRVRTPVVPRPSRTQTATICSTAASPAEHRHHEQNEQTGSGGGHRYSRGPQRSARSTSTSISVFVPSPWRINESTGTRSMRQSPAKRRGVKDETLHFLGNTAPSLFELCRIFSLRHTTLLGPEYPENRSLPSFFH